MEDVLHLYAEAPDPKRPVVCFDESPTQLIGEVRQPIPARSGQRERDDCEHKRNATVNLFVFLDAQRPWRKVKVSEHRAACGFAQCMRELVDVHYPQSQANQDHSRQPVDPIRPARSMKPFPPARRTACCAGWSSTTPPKHASWLTMVEIEIGVLRGQCLDRRIGDRELLVAEIAAWERQRNTARAKIKWMFTTERARSKLARAYPETAKGS